MAEGVELSAGAARLAAAPARAAHATRQHVDALFAPEPIYISDEQRALSLSCLSGLLSEIAGELSARVQQGNADIQADVETALHTLEDGAFVRSPEMASALLHRAEDHQIEMRLRQQAFVPGGGITPSGRSLLDRYLSDDDAALARLAELYLAARGKRVDQDDQPVLSAAELPDALATDLCWQVAGALAKDTSAASRQAWHDAARRQNALRDVSHAAQHRASRFAVRLNERGDLDAALLMRAFGDADVVLAASMIAARAEVTLVTAWALLFRSDVDALLALFMGMGFEKTETTQLAEIILAVSRPGAEPVDVPAQAAAVERELGKDGIAALLGYWRLNPAFRTVLEAAPVS